MILLPESFEDSVTDNTVHKTMETQPFVLHRDNPGTNLQTVGQNVPAHLPDPSVGGVNATKIQNGWSTGLVKRFKRFTGAVIIAPRMVNPVQGNVGNNNRAAALYHGVLNQVTQYTPSTVDYAASYVGPLYTPVQYTPGE